MNILTFNHTSNDFYESLNLSPNEDAQFIRSMIAFESLASILKVEDLYDYKDAPIEMKSMSSCIQKVCSLCKDDNQVVMAMLEFKDLYKDTLIEYYEMRAVQKEWESYSKGLSQKEKDSLSFQLKNKLIGEKYLGFLGFVNVVRESGFDFHIFNKKQLESKAKIEATPEIAERIAQIEAENMSNAPINCLMDDIREIAETKTKELFSNVIGLKLNVNDIINDILKSGNENN